MVSENLLKNVHVLIISHVNTNQNPLMIEGAGGADSSKTIFYLKTSFIPCKTLSVPYPLTEIYGNDIIKKI